ncbi:MAG: anthrone oxygenase family protein [Candidatus Methylomirabilales bacterium]
MFALLAGLCAGLFAGAAGYISLVEHWARLQAGPSVALAQFRPGFPRARGIQASLAIVGGGSALISWLAGGGASWLLVALILFGILGFTLISIRPVYNALLAPSLTAESPAARELLVRWGTLHQIRSALGLLAFLLALGSL